MLQDLTEKLAGEGFSYLCHLFGRAGCHDLTAAGSPLRTEINDIISGFIVRYLQQAWNEFDLTVEEGLKQLSTLTSIEMKVKDQQSVLKIPRPREQSRNLLKALDIRMPTVLPHKEVSVVTKKELPERRKVP